MRKIAQILWILTSSDLKSDFWELSSRRTVESLNLTVFICKVTTFVTVSPLSIIKIFQMSRVIWFCSYAFLTILCRCWLWHHFNSSPHNNSILLVDHKNLSQIWSFSLF